MSNFDAALIVSMHTTVVLLDAMRDESPNGYPILGVVLVLREVHPTSDPLKALSALVTMGILTWDGGKTLGPGPHFEDACLAAKGVRPGSN